MARRAAVAHAVYSPEVRHPVEVGADQEQHLVTWLSKRLGLKIKAPKLDEAGMALVGGVAQPPMRSGLAHRGEIRVKTAEVAPMQIHFGLDRDVREARIVVAMSGGVDSSVVAALAARTRCGSDRSDAPALRSRRSGEAFRSLLRRAGHLRRTVVADRLGIAHYVLDYESRFRSTVIENFADEYAHGRTPVPCASATRG